MSVFFNSIAAKGPSKDETFELAPFTCFVGLSEGEVASCGNDLKLLDDVSCRNPARWRRNSLLWQLLWI